MGQGPSIQEKLSNSKHYPLLQSLFSSVRNAEDSANIPTIVGKFLESGTINDGKVVVENPDNRLSYWLKGGPSGFPDTSSSDSSSWSRAKPNTMMEGLCGLLQSYTVQPYFRLVDVIDVKRANGEEETFSCYVSFAYCNMNTEFRSSSEPFCMFWEIKFDSFGKIVLIRMKEELNYSLKLDPKKYVDLKDRLISTSYLCVQAESAKRSKKEYEEVTKKIQTFLDAYSKQFGEISSLTDIENHIAKFISRDITSFDMTDGCSQNTKAWQDIVKLWIAATSSSSDSATSSTAVPSNSTPKKSTPATPKWRMSWNVYTSRSGGPSSKDCRPIEVITNLVFIRSRYASSSSTKDDKLFRNGRNNTVHLIVQQHKQNGKYQDSFSIISMRIWNPQLTFLRNFNDRSKDIDLRYSWNWVLYRLQSYCDNFGQKPNWSCFYSPDYEGKKLEPNYTTTQIKYFDLEAVWKEAVEKKWSAKLSLLPKKERDPPATASEVTIQVSVAIHIFGPDGSRVNYTQADLEFDPKTLLCIRGRYENPGARAEYLEAQKWENKVRLPGPGAVPRYESHQVYVPGYGDMTVHKLLGHEQ